MGRRVKKLISAVLAVAFVLSMATFAGAASNYVEGYVRGWVGDKLQIEAYDGRVFQYSYDKAATVFKIDERVAEPVDFKPGMEIEAGVNGDTLEYIEGYSTEVSGYIRPGSRIRTGTVQSIDRDQLVLKLSTGAAETYFTTGATIALKKGTNVPLSTLYAGDRVKLYFDEVNTSMVSRVEIEGDSVVIKDVYKGVLKLADAYQDTITLDSVQVYRNGAWEKVKSSMSLPYSGEVPVYMAGQKLLSANMKYYAGKTVYMAVKNFFGSNRIEKMVIRGQYEAMYSDKIQDINWYTGAFELANHKNVAFNEGTIFVKNGRLVDQYSINANSDAWVVADSRNGAGMADVVYIYNEDLNNSNIGQSYLYAGRLDQVLEDRLTLEDFFLLNQNAWESFSGDKELYLDNDTQIYDVENKKKITLEEFYAGDYSVDEGTDYAKDHNLKDWYGYIYTDGDRASGVLVQKSMDTLLRQRMTVGVVESVTESELVGWTIKLQNGADWSERNEKWMQKASSTSISVAKAMIIKDGKFISQDDLKAGDRLYIVRDGFDAKVVIVK